MKCNQPPYRWRPSSSRPWLYTSASQRESIPRSANMQGTGAESVVACGPRSCGGECGDGYVRRYPARGEVAAWRHPSRQGPGVRAGVEPLSSRVVRLYLARGERSVEEL